MRLRGGRGGRTLEVNGVGGAMELLIDKDWTKGIKRKLRKKYKIGFSTKNEWKKQRRKQKKQKTKRILKYREYIRSRQWEIRKLVFYKKNKKECVICKATYKIGLHHISYKNLGKEKDEDLVALCWNCHTTFHDQHGTEKINKNTYIYIQEEQEVLGLREIVKNL